MTNRDRACSSLAHCQVAGHTTTCNLLCELQDEAEQRGHDEWAETIARLTKELDEAKEEIATSGRVIQDLSVAHSRLTKELDTAVSANNRLVLSIASTVAEAEARGHDAGVRACIASLRKDENVLTKLASSYKLGGHLGAITARLELRALEHRQAADKLERTLLVKEPK